MSEEREEIYRVAPGQGRNCPRCGLAMKEEEIICLACGFNLETGKKVAKTYDPLELTWEYGLTLRQRLQLYFLCLGLLLLAGLPAMVWTGAFTAFLSALFTSAAALAFLLGTYETVNFSRNNSGKVRLEKFWRICFVPRPPAQIRIQEFSGVTTGAFYQSGFFEWLIAIILIFYGIVPGVLWWYFVINMDLLFVALCTEHGTVAQYVYRGKDEEQMNEITKILRSAFRSIDDA